MINITRIFTVLSFFTIAISQAQPFVLDETYATAGANPTYADCSNSVLLEGNKLVVATAFSPSYNTANATIGLKKYNADGSVDTTFGNNGNAQFFPSNINSRYQINALTVQPDGKFLLAGRTHIIGGFSYYYNFFLVRFNAEGTTDTSFGTNGQVIVSSNTEHTLKEMFNSVAIDAQGRILAAGYSEDDTSEKADAVAMRFFSNGEIDPSFADNGSLKLSLNDADAFSQIRVMADDSLLLFGTFTVSTTNQDIMIVKLADNGSYDTGFGTQGMATVDFDLGRDSVSNVFFKEEGKIMMVGSSTVNTLSARIAFAQLTANGTLDTSFSIDGKNTVPGTVPLHNTVGAGRVVLLPDGKYMTYSSSTRSDNSTNNYDIAVMRFNADGTRDTSFASNGVFSLVSTATSEYAYGIQVQNDGKVLLLVYSWNGASVASGTIYRYLNAYTLQSDEFASNADLQIFPNPATDLVQLRTQNSITAIEVFDVQGRKCLTVDNGFDQVNIGHLDSGVYFMKIKTGQGWQTQKILKK